MLKFIKNNYRNYSIILLFSLFFFFLYINFSPSNIAKYIYLLQIVNYYYHFSFILKTFFGQYICKLAHITYESDFTFKYIHSAYSLSPINCQAARVVLSITASCITLYIFLIIPKFLKVFDMSFRTVPVPEVAIIFHCLFVSSVRGMYL